MLHGSCVGLSVEILVGAFVGFNEFSCRYCRMWQILSLVTRRGKINLTLTVVVMLLYPRSSTRSRIYFSYVNFPTPGHVSKILLSDCGGGGKVIEQPR